jgi:hypothetical protein
MNKNQKIFNIPKGLVMVWSTMHKLYGVSFGFD